MTQAQERKLDRLAEVLELERGMHLLDVGCGWGGPLVYLCRRYGVTGHGIAVSARQVAAARERAARYGVGATFELVHWRNLPEVATYDAIYSDEVIVHFHDLEGFFRKCHGLLKSGRAMAHKELHLTHSSYGVLGPIGQHINKVFGFTGNYVTLQHEFQALDAAGFRLKNVVEIPMEHYHKTMDLWLSNIFEHRERLKQITSPVFYQEFRGHLKSYRRLFTTGHMRLDIVGSRKLD